MKQRVDTILVRKIVWRRTDREGAGRGTNHVMAIERSGLSFRETIAYRSKGTRFTHSRFHFSCEAEEVSWSSDTSGLPSNWIAAQYVVLMATRGTLAVLLNLLSTQKPSVTL